MPENVTLNTSLSITPAGQYPQARPNRAAAASSPSFADALAQASPVRFSNHAQKRLESRDIGLGNGQMERLAQAVDKAKAHGGKESLILMDDLAFIVNVREGLVVTTVDVNQRSQGVFTQIDSVVIAQPDGNVQGNSKV